MFVWTILLLFYVVVITVTIMSIVQINRQHALKQSGEMKVGIQAKKIRRKRDSQQASTSAGEKDSEETSASAAASALIARLGIEDDTINKLAELGDRSAVKPLIALLDNDNKRVRYAATVVLGRLGDQRAVQPLINQLLDPEPYLRRTAAWALGVLGDGSAVLPLIALLDDGHGDVRHDAAEALGNLGDPRAIEPLRTLSRDKDWVRQAAAQALENITAEQTNVVHKKVKQVKRLSFGGLTVGVISTIIGIAVILTQLLSKLPVRVPEAGIAWLIAGAALSIRSFRPPIGWKKGLAIFFGGLFVGVSILPISAPLRQTGHVDIGQISAFFIILIPGILMLRSGIRKSKDSRLYPGKNQGE